jgi:hypothetical protein
MSRSLSLIAGAFLLLTGCQPAVYRAETVLHSDGSVERAIYQPLTDTPEGLHDPAKWRVITYAPTPEQLDRQGWPLTLKALPPHGRDDQHSYIAAWQAFPSGRKIPAYLAMQAPPDLPAGGLIRETSRNDLVFVVEHRWQETLTDAVSWEGMHRARHELAALVIDLYEQALNDLMGQDFDFSRLAQWARSEGEAWLGELTDYLFLYTATHMHRDARATEGLRDGLVDICTRHGLNLRHDGKVVGEEGFRRALQGYAVGLALRHVRRRDATPLDRETVVAFLENLSTTSANGQPNRLDETVRRVIGRKYGGNEAFQQRLINLLVRVFGLYLLPLTPARHFDYTMTVPGEVVETNAILQSGNRVQWKFDAQDAYPLGYTMTCRALEPKNEVQERILKGQRLRNREAMLQYVSLVVGQERLLSVLRDCVRQARLAPLIAFRDASAANSPDRQKAQQLLRLLTASVDTSLQVH